MHRDVPDAGHLLLVDDTLAGLHRVEIADGEGPEDIDADPQGIEDPEREIQTGTHAEDDEHDCEGLEDGHEDRCDLAGAEDPERATRRLDRVHVAEDDAGADTGALDGGWTLGVAD